jgi:hypothetical protein
MSSPTDTTIHRQQSRQPHALPRHLRQPGEDGYRTPVIEDPEHPAYHRHRQLHSAQSPLSQVFDSVDRGNLPTSASSLEHRSRSEKSHRTRERDRCYLPEGFPESLNWRQRIKHVTWAYFTLTMATGGIQYLSWLLNR